MSDLYSVLGVEKNATEADIKRAYRKKAQEHHPDKNPGNKEAEQKFKQVQEAYDVLSDSGKRAQYDQFGQVGGGFPGGNGGGFPGGFPGGGGFDPNQFGGFADIFESFFGEGFNGGGGAGGGHGKKQGPSRGKDIETELTIKFEEAVFGVNKHLEITKPELCEHCKGKGNEPGTSVKTCPQCNGQGQVRSVRQTILGAIRSVHSCPQCQGRGEIPDQLCSICNGQTRIRKSSEVTVNIPKGIEDGTTIRLKGKGAAGAFGGEYGDLFLHITVAPHPKFSREGRTIYSSETIPLVQGVLGATIKVDTIHGKESLKVPAGTQDGTVLTVKGKGAPSLKTDALGDHKVSLHLKVPEKLTRKEKELYEGLAKEAGIEVNRGLF
ncbi:MAG: molecular chaperone DnaJ [Candidatus Gracilibacteria bacterium]|jgi:molecular chaperone DnaJ